MSMLLLLLIIIGNVYGMDSVPAKSVAVPNVVSLLQRRETGMISSHAFRGDILLMSRPVIDAIVEQIAELRVIYRGVLSSEQRAKLTVYTRQLVPYVQYAPKSTRRYLKEKVNKLLYPYGQSIDVQFMLVAHLLEDSGWVEPSSLVVALQSVLDSQDVSWHEYRDLREPRGFEGTLEKYILENIKDVGVLSFLNVCQSKLNERRYANMNFFRAFS